MSGGKDTARRVRSVIRQTVLDSAAYHVEHAAGMVKLDAMENPYALPDDLRRGWLERLRTLELNRYPAVDAAELKQRLRAAFAVPDSAGLLLGNGSDEIIQLLALAAARPGATLLAPEPGFSMYRLICDSAGLNYVGVPLRAPDFALDLAAMLAAIEAHAPALVFLAYPNNPTGNLFAEADIEAILRAAPGVVIVDEAYHAFAGHSWLPRLGQYGNLLVMRTLSKIGLAGLRLGFLAGAPEWLDQFEKLRLPYNVGVLTQASVCYFLESANLPRFDEQAARIRAERARLLAQLRSIAGVQVWDSAANFLLLRCQAAPATAVFESLKKAGVLVRQLHGSHPLLAECLRVTVGAPRENDAFLGALQGALGATG